MKLGIDLGGTSVKMGLVDEGRVVRSLQFPTRQDSDYFGIVEDIASAARSLSEGCAVDFVGVGSPGLVDTGTGRVCYSNNIQWKNAPLRDDLSGRLRLPVSVANDAKCAALGEAVYGAGRGVRRVAAVTLGTGVGGGFVVDGKLGFGSLYEDAAFIFGHMTIVPDGRQCSCGRKGCLEAYCSATALAERAEESFGIRSAKELFRRAEEGDGKALKILDEWTDLLKDGLVGIANILRPELIVIGGGLSASADVFLPRLQEGLLREVFGSSIAPVRVAAALLGNRAGVIGATLLPPPEQGEFA